MSEPVTGSPLPGSPTPPPSIPDHDLLGCIGRGSYGEVWLARNVLGEHRAVKIIHRRHFDSDHAYEREFEGLKRYEPVSRGDPSQVAVLHVGRNDTAGLYYYVMELADDANAEGGQRSGGVLGTWSNGARSQAQLPITPSLQHSTPYAPRTLKSELVSSKRLPVDECVQIGLALTTALEHLHGHGLIHRDIKPSNVIFVNGVPKLADIGLVARIDATMSFVGTEGYIPPEGPGTPQADLYSLGKVLYEISSGKDRTAFPEPLTLLGEEPEKAHLLELNAVIHQACHHDPRQRYPSAAGMHADLKRLERGESVRHRQLVQRRWATGRRVALAMLAVAVVVLAAYALYQTFVGPQEMVQSPDNPVPVPLKASVFVLPFRSEGTNEVGVDVGRLTDAFIDSLALIEGVRRSPRKSGWRNFDEDEIRHALARTNNMRHVLTGRTASSNETPSLTLRLYPRRSDQPLWTESFSGKTNELIGLEERALHQLAARLGLNIRADEQQRISTLLKNNLEALRWYQQAQAVYARKAGTQSGYTEVQKLAQRAMDLDGRFLDADFLDAYMLRCLDQDRAPSDIWRNVQRRMLSLLDQDDTYAHALDQMGGCALFIRHDWDEAYKFWNRGLRYRPERDGHFLRALYYRTYGWFDEARVEQERFEHPEPTDVDQRFFMASSRWVERRYAGGAQVARRTLELYPGHAEGYFWLAHCLVANSNYMEGVEATFKAQEVWKKQEMTALRAFAYAKMGQPEKAREGLQELLEVQRTGPYLQPYFVARVYAALNDKEKALEYLEKAEQESSSYFLHGDEGGGLRVDAAWDDLKEEPRFKELLKKVGLDQWPRPKPKDWPP